MRAYKELYKCKPGFHIFDMEIGIRWDPSSKVVSIGNQDYLEHFVVDRKKFLFGVMKYNLDFRSKHESI